MHACGKNMKLANVKIGKNLALTFGGAKSLIALMAGTGIRALHSVETAVDPSQFETENLILANKSSESTAKSMVYQGKSWIRRKSPEDIAARVVELRASDSAARDRIRTRESAAEGLRLAEMWGKTGLAANTVNLRVAERNKSGRRAEAGKAIHELQRWEESQRHRGASAPDRDKGMRTGNDDEEIRRHQDF